MQEQAIPYRLHVGVTGHRRLPDDPALREQVQAVLRRIQQCAPASSATPVRITVLSSLAEGADQLVTEEVLRLPDAHVEVILPMPDQQYRSEFEHAQSRSAFDDLLARAATVTAIPPMRSRAEAYARAGHMVVERCEVLVVLWDGQPAHEYEPTAEVVTWARARRRPLFWIETSAPFTIHEELGRMECEDAHRAGWTCTLPRWVGSFIPRWAGTADQCSSRPIALPLFHQVDAFNRTPVQTAQAGTRTYGELQRVLDGAEEAAIAPERIRPFTDWIMPFFLRADALALHYQRRFESYGTAFFIFAALWTVTPPLVVLLFGRSSHVQLVALLFIGLTWFVGYAGRDRYHLHRYWIGYRALAERLRSRFFLALVGVADIDEQLSEHLSPNVRADEWALRVFTEAWQRRPPSSWSEAEAATLAQFLARAWIADQVDYFHRTSERQRGHIRRLGRLTRVAFLLGIISVVINAFNSMYLYNWGRAFLAVSYLVPAAAAAMNGIGEQRGYGRNAERFARSAAVLGVYYDRMRSAPDLATVRAVAIQTEAALLEESHGWIFIMQDQDLQAHP